MHTGSKSSGEGSSSFCRNPRVGVKAFRKNCQGGPTILGFIAFLLTNILKFAWGVLRLHSPFPTSSPPPASRVHAINLCIWLIKNSLEQMLNSVEIMCTVSSGVFRSQLAKKNYNFLHYFFHKIAISITAWKFRVRQKWINGWILLFLLLLLKCVQHIIHLIENLLHSQINPLGTLVLSSSFELNWDHFDLGTILGQDCFLHWIIFLNGVCSVLICKSGFKYELIFPEVI